MSPRGSAISMRGRAPPELAQPGDGAARHGSHPSTLGQLARRMGESGILTHNIVAKLADIASTAARIVRPVQAGRPSARYWSAGDIGSPSLIEGAHEKVVFRPSFSSFASATARSACISTP